MNYDQPRQLERNGKPTGTWHYTTMNRRSGTHPIGFCSDHEPHPSEEEARACYRGYQRTRVKLDIKFGNWHGCEYRGCDVPSKVGADAGDGWYAVTLCPEHLAVEYAIEALGLHTPLAGDSVHS